MKDANAKDETRGLNLGGEPVGGNLQAAHGPAIKRPDQRQTSVGQTELRLPDWQKRVKLVGVAVMEEMGEARARSRLRRCRDRSALLILFEPNRPWLFVCIVEYLPVGEITRTCEFSA